MADDVTYYVVDDTAKSLGYAASEFYGRPSEKLRAMVSDGSSYYIINGELKPGIRTKDINRINLK